MVLVTAAFVFTLFAVTVTWYSLTPVFNQLSGSLNSTAFNMSLPSSTTTSVNRIGTVLGYLWPILLAVSVIGVISWLYIQSQRVDYESGEFY